MRRLRCRGERTKALVSHTSAPFCCGASPDTAAPKDDILGVCVGTHRGAHLLLAFTSHRGPSSLHPRPMTRPGTSLRTTRGISMKTSAHPAIASRPTENGTKMAKHRPSRSHRPFPHSEDTARLGRSPLLGMGAT
ncbi:hypothetical protein OH77DRAFT_360392 [Trametes cingulata]|nr:hypothetical protein OH77DRAFT_360392 [Trametes cingulata]